MSYEQFKEINRRLDGLASAMTAGFAEVRADMNTGFAEVRAEMNTGFAEVRADMNTGFAEVKAESVRLRADMDAGFGAMRTVIDAGFADADARLGDLRTHMGVLHEEALWRIAGSREIPTVTSHDAQANSEDEIGRRLDPLEALVPVVREHEVTLRRHDAEIARLQRRRK